MDLRRGRTVVVEVYAYVWDYLRLFEERKIDSSRQTDIYEEFECNNFHIRVITTAKSNVPRRHDKFFSCTELSYSCAIYLQNCTNILNLREHWEILEIYSDYAAFLYAYTRIRTSMTQD